MNEQLADLKGIHSVSHAKGNLYWFVNSKMAYLEIHKERLIEDLYKRELSESIRATALFKQR